MTAFVPKAFESMRRNRDVLFFLLNACGWAGWALSQLVNFKLFDTYPYGAALTAVAACGGFVLTIGLRYVCQILWRQRPLVLIVGGFLSAFLFTLAYRA